MNVLLKKQLLITAAKFLVLLLTLYYLYRSVVAPAHVQDFAHVYEVMRRQGGVWLLLAFLLIPVNWGLEAWKWWLLANKLEKVSWLRAFRSVMVGLTLGFITPNRIGDYAGRILELKSRRRADAVGAIFLGRYCQLLITVAAGSAGLLYFILRFYLQEFPAIKAGVILLFLALNTVAMLALFQNRILLAFFGLLRPLRRFLHYLQIMTTYTFAELLRVLLLSLLRYCVFVFQFLLLLRVFGVQQSFFTDVAAIAGTFLLKSVVPSISALTDIGMRELSAVHLFGLLGQPELQVLGASLGLWLLNIALPSAAGLVFVFRLRVLNHRRDAAFERNL